jgi:hypothetical protein
VAVIALVACPVGDAVNTWLLPLAALPYYVAYCWDLRVCGRSPMSIFQVYGLNLLLLPVHLSGAVASLIQAFTGRPVPFQRTPKVEGRTSTPISILVPIWLAPGALAGIALNDFFAGEYARAGFSSANAIVIAGAALYFIGARATLEDLRWGRLVSLGLR